MATREDITMLLKRIDEGRSDAMDELMRVVYADLERMAQAHLQRVFQQHAQHVTLEPAALVNETFLRLIRQHRSFDNRRQFFAIATKLMLRVLIDYRRRRLLSKRAVGDPRVTLAVRDAAQRAPGAGRSQLVDVEDLSEALDRLETLDARKADVVKMRVVWGMEIPAIAESLGVSPSTVDRDWKFAKAWIADEVGLLRA